MSKEILNAVFIENAPGRSIGVHDRLYPNQVTSRIVRIFEGEDPPGLSEVDAVIIGGGPMGVYEIDKPEYNFLKKAEEYLLRAVDSGKPVLGICLGHQLLAHSLGGVVVRQEDQAEFGWTQISLSDEGKKDSLFLGCEAEFISFESHNDQVVTLPENTKLLARSARCPIQAFKLEGYLVWGVQFHPEVQTERGREILRIQQSQLKSRGDAIEELINQEPDASLIVNEKIFANFFDEVRKYNER